MSLNSKRSPIQIRSELLPVAVVCAAGFGLRMFRLTHQSMWDDEVSQYMVSLHSLPDIWTRIAQIDSNPMLSYTLLKGWMALGFHSDYGLRLLSVLLGTLAVLLSYLVARRLAGRAEALLCSLLVAVSPMLVMLSQDVRYNAPAIVLVLGAQLALLRLIQRGGWGSFAMLVICGTASIYTHYLSGLNVIATALVGLLSAFYISRIAGRQAADAAGLLAVSLDQVWAPLKAFGLAAVAQWRRTIRDSMRRSGLALLAVLLTGLAFVPWLKTFITQFFVGTPWRETLSMRDGLFLIASQLMLTPTPDRAFGLIEPLRAMIDSDPAGYQWRAWLVLLPLWGLVLAGAAMLRRDRQRIGSIAVLLGAPMAGFLAVASLMHVYEARYAAPFLPLVLLMISVALVRLWQGGLLRRALCVGFAAYLGLTTMLSLREYYFDEDYARQNWRGVAEIIQQQEGEDDFLVYYHIYKGFPLNRYYRGESEQHYLIDYGEWDLPPQEYDARCERIANAMESKGGDLWLLAYHDFFYDPPGPDGRTRFERTVARHGYVPEIVHCERWGLRRLCLKRFHRDPGAARTGFGSVIDFGGEFEPLQLAEGWYENIANGFVFIGPEAALELRAPDLGEWIDVSAEIYTPVGLLGGPVEVSLLVNGEIAASEIFDRDGVYTVRGSIENIDPGGILQVTIVPDRSFIPAEVGFPGDTSVKSIQVRRVALEGANR